MSYLDGYLIPVTEGNKDAYRDMATKVAALLRVFGATRVKALGDMPFDGKRVFSALGEGGIVTMPLMKTFWTSSFGMLTDKFGVPWMVNVAMPTVTRNCLGLPERKRTIKATGRSTLLAALTVPFAPGVNGLRAHFPIVVQV